MNLKLVTWDGDLVQFLVEATSDEEAVNKAIEANFKYADPGEDDDGMVATDMRDPGTYTVEDVDFAFLSEIFSSARRNYAYGEAIIFDN